MANVCSGWKGSWEHRSGCLPSAQCVYHVIFLWPPKSSIIPVYLYSPVAIKLIPFSCSRFHFFVEFKAGIVPEKKEKNLSKQLFAVDHFQINETRVEDLQAFFF